MCAVSAISDVYMHQWPNWQQFPPIHYPLYTEILEKARKYDEMTKQPDCPDPKKLEWQRQLEKYMRDTYGMEPKK